MNNRLCKHCNEYILGMYTYCPKCGKLVKTPDSWMFVCVAMAVLVSFMVASQFV